MTINEDHKGKVTAITYVDKILYVGTEKGGLVAYSAEVYILIVGLGDDKFVFIRVRNLLRLTLAVTAIHSLLFEQGTIYAGSMDRVNSWSTKVRKHVGFAITDYRTAK